VTRTPSTPPELDGYRYVRPLGSGGFSDVHLYEQLLPRREVAVKVLLTDLGPAGLASFTSEANLMARLSTHPYIVTIHDAGISGDRRPYLVMEYCSRPTLAERYKQRPLAVDEALRTGLRLASAIETAHRAGILHRDIKPGNVLTNDYGWPALTDFGIAAAADAAPAGRDGEGSDPEASTGGSIGLSVPWSPPEMFLDVPEHDVRSDVFSLAATLYTVLAGRTPFELPGGPNTAVDLMARIDRGQVAPLDRSDVPRSLAHVLERGMAPRREDRWPSALDLGRALQRVELELGLASTSLEIADAVVPPTAAPDGDDAETRVRAIPAVQPDLPPRLTPAPQPAPAAETPVATAGPSRTRLVGILVGVLSLLVVSGVTLAIVLTGGMLDRPGGQPSPSATGGSAVGADRIPAAVDGQALPSVDGTSVEFSWTHPDPRDGDLYYWARSETPDDRAAVRESAVTVVDIVPGSRVCINVEIGRSGRTSEPLVICTS
jgi:serine/threonine protein kinase